MLNSPCRAHYYLNPPAITCQDRSAPVNREAIALCWHDRHPEIASSYPETDALELVRVVGRKPEALQCGD